jgi:hypothetical protein
VPPDDGFRLNNGQGGSPVGPEPGEPHPEDAVAAPQPRAFDGLLEDSSTTYYESSEEYEDGLDDAQQIGQSR